MPTSQEIKFELEKNGLFITEKAISDLMDELGPKMDVIKQSLLDTDFKNVGDKILPKDISKTKENQSVKLPLVLQVVSIRNISLPESKQWSSTNTEDSSRRTLLIHLTDGHTVCRALEVSQLSQLRYHNGSSYLLHSFNTPPGSKIKISGNTLKTNQGFVIFDSDVKVELLGGVVPDLQQTWKAKQLAATRKLLGTKTNVDGEGPPMFKPIEISQPKPKENKSRKAEGSSTKKIETTNNDNNNNNNTQRKSEAPDQKPQFQKKQQPQQKDQNLPNTQTETSNSNTQTNKKTTKQKEPKYREVKKTETSQPVESVKEPKYREVKKTETSQPVESIKEPTPVKEPPQQQQKAKIQQYAPKQRGGNQNNNYERKKTSDKEPKFVPKQQSTEAYKQKHVTNHQVLQLSYLPQITQIPTTFSATCRVLQVGWFPILLIQTRYFWRIQVNASFCSFRFRMPATKFFWFETNVDPANIQAMVDNPELLENIVSMSIAELKTNCATPDGQVLVQKRTEQSFQSLLNQVVTFAFAVIYPGIPFSILSIQ